MAKRRETKKDKGSEIRKNLWRKALDAGCVQWVRRMITEITQDWKLFLKCLSVYIFLTCTQFLSYDPQTDDLQAAKIDAMNDTEFNSAIQISDFKHLEIKCRDPYNRQYSRWEMKSYYTEVIAGYDFTQTIQLGFIFLILSIPLEKYVLKNIKNRWIRYVLNSIIMQIFFITCMFVYYTRTSFPTMKPGSSSYLENFENVVRIFLRVHPRSDWVVRLSHAIAYPLYLYQVTRPTVSSMYFYFILYVTMWPLHRLGDIGHMYYSDPQVQCVRNNYIWTDSMSDPYFESIRVFMAPYMNLFCLPVDCRNFVGKK